MVLVNDVFVDFKLLIMTALLTPPDGSNDENYKRILERIEGIMEGYMRSSTNMCNELARIRKHHREDKNDVVDEMCRQHKENTFKFKDVLSSADSLVIELQHMRKVMEALVHSYNNDQIEENGDDWR